MRELRFSPPEKRGGENDAPAPRGGDLASAATSHGQGFSVGDVAPEPCPTCNGDGAKAGEFWAPPCADCTPECTCETGCALCRHTLIAPAFCQRCDEWPVSLGTLYCNTCADALVEADL